jgi:tRNA threonylcarbamoyl adenosine modification protein YeaZ
VLVLGIDTSTPATAVAVCTADPQTGVVDEHSSLEVVDQRRSAELLAPLISEALAACGRSPRDLDAIVVGLGPGPYTSLRVGIVTAAALGDALGVAVYGVCSLDGLVDRAQRVTAVTDARRREVYWARYVDGHRVAGPDVSAPALVAAALTEGEKVIGAGGALYASVFGAAYDAQGRLHPDPVAVIRCGVPQLGTPAAPLVPLYQRRPDATPRTAA